MSNEDGDDGSNGDEQSEQASIEITMATHNGMIAASVAGTDGETAEDLVEVVTDVLDDFDGVQSERKIGFE